MRFSRRLPETLRANRLTELLDELRSRPGGVPLWDLTCSNPTTTLPELYAGEAGRALLAPLAQPGALVYAPTPRGSPSARAAIAAYYQRRGLAVDPEGLTLCASTSEAYSWLFQLLCEPGERVLFPQPSYPLLSTLAELASVRVERYPLWLDPTVRRFRIDLEALRAAITDETRALVIVSPNNPTGSALHRDEVRAVLELCREHRLALVADEVFSDYLLDASEDLVPSLLAVPELGERGPLAFVMSGFSKVLGLPQLKLGWIATLGAEPLRSAAQERLEHIADTFLSVGTPVQLAAPALLAEQPRIRAAIVARLAVNLAALRSRLAGSSCDMLPVEGGWSAVLRLPALCSEEEYVLSLLEQERVLVQPGYFFDFSDEPLVVVSLLTPPSVLDEGLGRLLSRIAELGG